MKKINGNDNDRLTSLPDVLIISIFSFLSRKDVFSLCISSKKLQHLLVYIPYLDFKQYNYPLSNGSTFTKTVTHVLQNRVYPIKTFTLDFDNPKKHTHLITRWIRLLKQVGVDEVDLNFMHRSYEIPASLFQLDKLKAFKLTYCKFLKPRAGFPGFCLLEELHFVCVRVEDHELTRVISKCPNLRSLTVSGCGVGEIRVVNVESKLETLHLKSCKNCGVVSVPSLENLYYSNVDVDLNLKDGTRPTTVEIIRGGEGYEEDGQVLSSMKTGILENLMHVENLSLLGTAFKYFALDADYFMPIDYSKLVKVEVKVSLTEPKEASALFCLLQRAGRLGTLIIKMKSIVKDVAVWECMQTALVCGCLNTLKWVHISRLTGNSAELEFINFVVDKAAQLQIMTISRDQQTRSHLRDWNNLQHPKIEKV